MKTRILSLPLVICLFLSITACKKKTGSENNPPSTDRTTDSSYRSMLAKGINLSNWFNDYSDPTQYADRFTEAHFATIRSSGFTYVRIPIGQNILFQPANPSVLKPANLPHVESAVQKAMDHGLVVMINYHTASDQFEMTLPSSTENQDKLAEYWKAIAKHFKKFGPEKIVFEVYNEPHVASNGSLPSTNRLWWEPVQKKLIDAIRSETTDHFIIAGGEGWNSIEGLTLLKPYLSPNIVYNFHFYDPFFFTHQGATWTGAEIQKLRNLPYPSSPELVAPILDTATDADVIQYVTWYGDDSWNAGRLSQLVSRAKEWSATNNTAIICNEFGSYKPYAPRQSRLNCIADIRSTLEAHGIGWAMWEMDEGFGFINYTDDTRSSFTIDNEVLISLGLN